MRLPGRYRSVALSIAIAAIWRPLSAAPATAGAQERPAKRIAAIVGVAMEEYVKAIGPDGGVISELEYQETIAFLSDARQAAERLSGDRAAESRAIIDSLLVAVRAKAPPQTLVALRDRFAQSLGADAALDLPTRVVDVAAVATVSTEMRELSRFPPHGDGPAARGMTPPPPALGSAQVMRDVTPALMYRIVSVGIGGTAMGGFGGELSPDQRWDLIGYLVSLRHPRAAVAQGEGIFALQCSACHGSSGLGDGPLARALSKLPPEIGSFAWQAERHDAQLATAIRDGVPGTPMPAGRMLTDSDVTSAVAYLASWRCARCRLAQMAWRARSAIQKPSGAMCCGNWMKRWPLRAQDALATRVIVRSTRIWPSSRSRRRPAQKTPAWSRRSNDSSRSSVQRYPQTTCAGLRMRAMPSKPGCRTWRL